MHIAVIGTGYVGLVTGACFAEFGVDVICVDVDEQKIAQLFKGVMPIYEPGLEQLVAKNTQAGRLKFTTDVSHAIQQSLVIFLAVGTPPMPDGSPDLSYIEAAAGSVADHMNDYKVVVTNRQSQSAPANTFANSSTRARKQRRTSASSRIRSFFVRGQPSTISCGRTAL